MSTVFATCVVFCRFLASLVDWKLSRNRNIYLEPLRGALGVFFSEEFRGREPVAGGGLRGAMPRYTTSQTYTDGNTQIVALPEGEGASNNGSSGALVPVVGAGSGAIVEYKGGEGAIKPLDDEDLEVKLRRISEQVPVRISNTSGSSAGSGSGDFHQVCSGVKPQCLYFRVLGFRFFSLLFSDFFQLVHVRTAEKERKWKSQVLPNDFIILDEFEGLGFTCLFRNICSNPRIH